MRLTIPTRPPRRDVLIAVVLTAVLVAVNFGAATHLSKHPEWGSGEHYSTSAVAYVLIAAEGLTLAWRRVHPTAVLVVVFAIETAYTLASFVPGPVYVPLIIAFATCIVRGDRRVAYATLVAGYLIALTPGFGHASLASLLGLAAWLAVLAALAEIVRIRLRVRRAEALEAARTAEAEREQSRRRAGEERLRIARDLHDVLAHHLALITVQANAGLVTLNRDTKRTETALHAIKDSGNAALGELRSVLDLLRAGQDDPAPRDPTPMLSRPADLSRLIDGARAAGLNVGTETVGDERPLPGPVDRAAFRIVQEALTNAVRHAGPGTSVRVRIRYAENELRLIVDDDGRGTASVASRHGGNGLPGMRERAAALGGTLRAEPTDRGGFLVEAVLPTGDADAVTPGSSPRSGPDSSSDSSPDSDSGPKTDNGSGTDSGLDTDPVEPSR